MCGFEGPDRQTGQGPHRPQTASSEDLVGRQDGTARPKETAAHKQAKATTRTAGTPGTTSHDGSPKADGEPTVSTGIAVITVAAKGHHHLIGYPDCTAAARTQRNIEPTTMPQGAGTGPWGYIVAKANTPEPPQKAASPAAISMRAGTFRDLLERTLAKA